MENRVYAYARVSSKEQNEERQLKAFEELGINERDIFLDKQSGKDFDREQYLILKRMLRENDLLVIKSIDRLGRSYDLIIEEWRDITKNIKADIKVIDMPILDTSNNKELLGNVISDIVLGLLSYVAEEERNFIRQRHQAYLSKNIFKLKLKSNSNITTEEKILLGESLIRIAKLSKLNTSQTKRLIKKWYSNSQFKDRSFEWYYTNLINYFDDEVRLNPNELCSTLNNMGISEDKYNKEKNKYYINLNIRNKLYYNALQHIRYENKRIEEEIIYEMNNLW